MSLFCKHDWTLMQKDIFESRLERLTEQLESFKCYSFDLPGLASKTVIYLVSCKKCGSIRKFKESV